jgi:hypothetical protein
MQLEPSLAYSKVQELLVAGGETQYFSGRSLQYDELTGGMTLRVTGGNIVGTGSLSSWTINLAGAVGQAGPAGPTGADGATGSPGAPITQYVSSFNGRTGAVQGVSSFNGLTGAVQGVASFNGLTGAVQGVSSFNGLTGAVTGLVSFNGLTDPDVIIAYVSGITALDANSGFQAIAFSNVDPPYNTSISIRNTGVLSYNGTGGNVQGVSTFNGQTGTVTGVSRIIANTFLSTSPVGGTGTVTIINQGVRTFNGSTGTIEGVSKIISSAGIAVSPAGGTGNVTISNTGVISLSPGNGIRISPATGNSTVENIGVLSFNGTTGSVQGVFDLNGLTGIVGLSAGNNITITPSGNTLIIAGQASTGLTQAVLTLNGLSGPVGLSGSSNLTITPSGNTLVFAVTNTGLTQAVLTLNGLSGPVGLSAGTNINIVPSGNTLVISSTASSSSGVTDGSAVISQLYPRGVCSGISAGSLIAFSGQTWTTVPRTYIATPSLWQTKPTSGNVYPTSKIFQYNVGSANTIDIDGSTAGGSPEGELFQLACSYDDSTSTTTGGVTLDNGTWWINYSYYSGFAAERGFLGQYSGLTLINAPFKANVPNLLGGLLSNYSADILYLVGFAIKIRGATYNALDGRGGPYGNTYCYVDPYIRPLGVVGCTCCADGVEDWRICSPGGVPLPGFTYNGCFVDGCGNFTCP